MSFWSQLGTSLGRNASKALQEKLQEHEEARKNEKFASAFIDQVIAPQAPPEFRSKLAKEFGRFTPDQQWSIYDKYGQGIQQNLNNRLSQSVRPDLNEQQENPMQQQMPQDSSEFMQMFRNRMNQPPQQRQLQQAISQAAPGQQQGSPMSQGGQMGAQAAQQTPPSTGGILPNASNAVNETVGKENYKENLDFLKTQVAKKQSQKTTSARLDKLDRLNKTGKLPNKLLARLTTKDNQILIPVGLSPEAEEYLKTINDFMSEAKDIFPGRVTNADLSAFFAKLPNLLQSPEGRARVTQDLKDLNKAAQEYTNAAIQFGKSQDLTKINPAQREEYLEGVIGDRVDKILDHYRGEETGVSKNYKSFADIDTSSLKKGQKAKDKKTGEVKVWNGKSWQVL